MTAESSQVLPATDGYLPRNGCISIEDLHHPAFRRILDEMHSLLRVPRRKRKSFARCKGSSRLEPAWMWSRRHWEYPWAVLNAALGPGLRVLDCGAGIGALQFYLASRNLEVYANGAADLRSKRLRQLQQALRTLGVAWRLDSTARHRRLNRLCGVNVRYTPANCAELPYRDNTFERVFSISVLEHMDDETLRAAMAEMERVLKPGGLLVLTFDFHPIADLSLIGFTPEDFERKILGACRLRLVGNRPHLNFPDWQEYLAALDALFEDSQPNTACGVVLAKD